MAAREAFKKYPSIQRFCADAGYCKTFEQDVSSELWFGVDISVRIKPEWEVLPKRWIVERMIYCFEMTGKFFRVAVVDILKRIPQHVNYAPLELGLGIDRADGFLKTGHPIDAKEKNSL